MSSRRRQVATDDIGLVEHSWRVIEEKLFKTDPTHRRYDRFHMRFMFYEACRHTISRLQIVLTCSPEDLLDVSRHKEIQKDIAEDGWAMTCARMRRAARQESLKQDPNAYSVYMAGAAAGFYEALARAQGKRHKIRLKRLADFSDDITEIIEDILEAIERLLDVRHAERLTEGGSGDL